MIFDLPATATVQIPPDPSGTRQAFARVGYQLQDAIADLIDNSIDASASHILVRFFRTNDRIVRIAIADDGIGMDEERLTQAMKFGARMPHASSDIGQYGIGMKAAALSQGRGLIVVSRSGKSVSGRRWTIGSIDSGWDCECLARFACENLLRADWLPVVLANSGTVVLLEDLDRLRPGPEGVEQALERLMPVLSNHLGLVFHRFIRERGLQIRIDAVNTQADSVGPPRDVSQLDPFNYKRSGANGFPKRFLTTIENVELEIEGHVWPARSREPGYKLGGRAAARQGIYFYRNDRLLQAGGWNGWHRQEAEPHLSLARARIEIDAQSEGLFRPNMQKSGVDVPVDFSLALDAARGPLGETFQSYVAQAESAYRASAPVAAPEQAVLPGDGIPRRVRRLASKLVDANGGTRTLDFKWAKLDTDDLIEIDRDTDTVKLNRDYRAALRQGMPGNTADAPLVKTLLYLLLHEEFARQRLRETHKEYLEVMTSVLTAAARSHL